MNRQAILQSIEMLRILVKALRSAKVNSIADYKNWQKEPENMKLLEHIFGYDLLPPDKTRPKIAGLVRPHFHPNLPLIGFNYTPLAHNTLHLHQEGWTQTLRLCRGIIFDLETAGLLALVMEKFFNYGDSGIGELPDGECEATAKYDGHMGIIFRYQGRFLIATRGSFCSPTAKFAQEILDRYVMRNLWTQRMPSLTTVIVEIVDPRTKVFVDYGDRSEFILIAALEHDTEHIARMNENETIDYSHGALKLLGPATLGLKVAERMPVNNWQAVLAEVKNRSVTNREGFVVRFADGTRVKFKYETYIGQMVAAKLSLTYLMKRATAGNLEKMIATLPEEIHGQALKMLGEMALIMFAPGDAKTKWRRLYELMPEDEQTDSYKSDCRAFAKAFSPAVSLEK